MTVFCLLYEKMLNAGMGNKFEFDKEIICLLYTSCGDLCGRRDDAPLWFAHPIRKHQFKLLADTFLCLRASVSQKMCIRDRRMAELAAADAARTKKHHERRATAPEH